MDNGLKEIFTALQERIRTPVYGSIFLALIVLNWKVVFVLVFTKEPYVDKFKYFADNTCWLSLFVIPFLLGLLMVYITPRVANFTAKFVAEPKLEKKKFEMNQAYDFKEAEEARKATLEQLILDRKTESAGKLDNIQDKDLKEAAKQDLLNAEKYVEDDYVSDDPYTLSHLETQRRDISRVMQGALAVLKTKLSEKEKNQVHKDLNRNARALIKIDSDIESRLRKRNKID